MAPSHCLRLPGMRRGGGGRGRGRDVNLPAWMTSSGREGSAAPAAQGQPGIGTGMGGEDSSCGRGHGLARARAHAAPCPLASVTSAAQQAAVEQLIGHRQADSAPVWIGLNDFAEEGTFVWSDDEPLEYSNLSPYSHAVTGQPCGTGNPDGDISHCGDGVAVCGSGRPFCPPHNGAMPWWDHAQVLSGPYICKRKTIPAVATGGEMLGCVGGRWVLGTPYRSPRSMIRLPPTIVSSRHSIF